MGNVTHIKEATKNGRMSSKPEQMVCQQSPFIAEGSQNELAAHDERE